MPCYVRGHFKEVKTVDRTLALEFVRVTEAAALRSGRLLGRGEKDGADQLAVDAMRQNL